MKIFREISDINTSENSVLTVGTFDGIHLGHQTILNLVKDIAGKSNYRSAKTGNFRYKTSRFSYYNP